MTAADWEYAVLDGWDVCHVARPGDYRALCGRPLEVEYTTRSATSPKGTTMCAGCWDERQRLARAERGWRARRDDRGATAVEYAILCALVAVLLIPAVDRLYEATRALFLWSVCEVAECVDGVPVEGEPDGDPTDEPTEPVTP